MLEPAFGRPCPKCSATCMQRKRSWYPILGYGEVELACLICGLNLWPRPDESPRQSYYRWLMDRVAAY